MCPLPIDWLDFLEDRPSAAKAEHLDTCVSCAALVSRLHEYAIEPPVKAISWGEEPSGSSWGANAQPDLSFGQIWLSAPAFSEDGFSYEVSLRVPLLILGVERRDDGFWVDSVPLWTDLELATASDLILDADSTTLFTPLRALFDMQGRIAERQLETCIGALTASGQAIIAQEFSKYEAVSHGFAAPDDPRVAASTELLRNAMGALHSFALHRRDLPHAPQSTFRESTMAREMFPLELHWETERPYQPDLQLAASTHPPERRFVVELKAGPRQFRGVLRHDVWQGDRILLAVDVTEGIDTPIQIVFRTARSEAVSSPFVPKRDAEAVLTQRAGIMLDEIDSAAMVQS